MSKISLFQENGAMNADFLRENAKPLYFNLSVPLPAPIEDASASFDYSSAKNHVNDFAPFVCAGNFSKYLWCWFSPNILDTLENGNQVRCPCCDSTYGDPA